MSMPASQRSSQIANPDTSTWASAEARVDGARMHYVEAGKGEPVILLHGYPQSHMCWRHQIDALAARYRVIAPDWIGFGRSERRLDVVPSYSAESERIGQFAATLGLSRFNLICHDYGGYIGLGYVIRHPEAVLRFGILNSRAHGIFTPTFYGFSRRQHWVAKHRLTRGLASLLPLAMLHRRSLRRYVARGCFSNQQLHDYLSWMDERQGRRWYFHFFEHYYVPVRPELAAGLATIRCPSAVIWGDRDPFIPFTTAEELSTGMPNATLTRIRGADHYVMEERPNEVTSALLRLLEKDLY